MDSYLPHVGFVQFPRQPLDLSAAVCPACFVPRRGQHCAHCGLDFTNPVIAELDAASTDAAASLDRRLELIGRIRYEAVAAAAPAPVVAAAAPAATTVAPPAPVTPPPPVLAAVPAEPRRHLGVQVILLIVGVSLLAVGAIFFLVYAFITFGLVWRSVIIGAVTVASFVGASLLRRRRLAATGEAIAALAVVFVYLDAFAIRANDLFGLGDSDELVYWGTALLVSSIGFAVWHRLSGLRLPSVVAFLSFAPALALLAGGLTEGLDDGVRIFIAFLVLGAATLAHPLSGGKAIERTTSLVLALVGLLVAALVALFMLPLDDWAPLVGLALVAAVATAHVVVLSRLGTGRALAVALACFAAAVAASAFIPVATRIDDTAFGTVVPVLAAASVALALEYLARRMPALTTTAAAWSGAIVGIALALVASVALFRAVTIASLGRDRWSVEGGTSLDTQPVAIWTIVALAAVVALTAVAWALGGTLRARRLVVVSSVLALLVLAVPLTGQLWTTVLGWLALGAAAVVALVVGRRRDWGAGIRIALTATGLVSLALSYSTSWASIDTWWFASVGTVALLVVARAATDLVPVRAALLAVATVLAFVAIGSEAWHTNERFQGGADAGIDAAHAVLLLAILLIGLAAALAGRLSALETRVLFWLSAGSAIVTVSISAAAATIDDDSALVFADPMTSVVLGALLLGALVPWLVRSGFTGERIATSIAVAPVAAWVAVSVVRLAGGSGAIWWVAPLLAALVVAAASLALAGRGQREARDLGVVAVTLPVLLVAVTGSVEATWLVLVLAGVVTLLLAVSRDGLFGSASARKHLGWLALALAFAGLARSLADRDVRDLEPYVLPLTGALLIVALLDWRAHRTSTAPAFISLGALLVSLVPLGAVSGTGALERALIVVGVSALLLLAGSFLRGSIYLDVAAAAGAAGVVVAGFARPFVLALAGGGDYSLDAWLSATLLILLLAAVGQSRTGGRSRTGGQVRSVVAQVVLAIPLAVVVLIEIVVLPFEPASPARALIVVAVLAALHIVGMLVEKPPFTRVVAWIALALAAIMVVAGSVAGALDPFEWGTVILAAALLTTGTVLLRRHPAASSWVWIAPGLLVLLLPSLLATFVDQPVWRLVGIGVVCVVAIVVGAVLKLQAPLLIGTAVVLIHAIRTFSPQLVAVYQLTEWWVWAVVGGAIIIFVAVTFERRVRDLKSVGGRIAALR